MNPTYTYTCGKSLQRRSKKEKITGVQTLLPLDLAPIPRITPPVERRGVVYTKPWVIDLILDLVGYTPDQPLHRKLIVEPSAGDGAFLRQIVVRLAESCQRHNIPLQHCGGAIVGYELDDESAERGRSLLRQVLRDHDANSMEAHDLAAAWIRTGDYLLDAGALNEQVDFVVGNPPYIRLEDLDAGGAFYRSLYKTMVGRADIYVAFYEAALRHLKPGGACGLICADRWMFNQYGAELRRFITRRYSVDAVIQMHHADAFESEVSAYPAITIIRNADQGPVIVANLDPEAESIGAAALAAEFTPGYKTDAGHTNAAQIDEWFKGADPWPLIEPRRLALLRRLEAEYPAIEDTGAIVGIGVATGADKVFVTKDPNLVESDQMLPLAMAADAKGSSVSWSGHYLVNPWNGKGLVDLRQYPKLATYLGSHRTQLQGRHVGQKVPSNWYRTIDRVDAGLTARPKLYLPDFKGRIAPVLDHGKTYPHHNLYFISPEKWDPEVLGGLLLSDVAQFFIEAYGVKMRGGYFRFQAQYLRRIRLPEVAAVSAEQAARLGAAFARHDVTESNAVAAELYRLTTAERALIGH